MKSLLQIRILVGILGMSVSLSLFAGGPIEKSPELGKKERVAIIGAGAAGMVSAWLLDNHYQVTLFEKQDRLGGNADTLNFRLNPKDSTTYPIDVGFEFINENGFPHFVRLLKELHVPLRSFQLTTSYSVKNSEVKVSPISENQSPFTESFVLTPFSHQGIAWGTLFNFHKIRELLSMRKVFNEGQKYVDSLAKNPNPADLTMEEFLNSLRLDHKIQEDFLIPFLSAGFGVPAQVFKTWSADCLLRTVLTKTSGLSTPEWLEIEGGTQVYMNALASQFRNVDIQKQADISDITYESGVYSIHYNWVESQFDKVVLATPAESAVELVRNLHFDEADAIRTVLSSIHYKDTIIAVHGDTRFMPLNKDHWSVVNVRSYPESHRSAMTVYKKWHSPEDTPLFKSFLTPDDVTPVPLYAQVQFRTLDLTPEFRNAENELKKYQGTHGLYFAGAYLMGDRHEYAVISAIDIAEKLSPQSNRLAQLIQH